MVYGNFYGNKLSKLGLNDGDIDMKKWLTILLAVSCLVLPLGYSEAASPQDIQRVVDSTVQIRTATGAGSGVIVSKDATHTYIITNYHVVGENFMVGVTLDPHSKRSHIASVLARDEENDLAIVRVGNEIGGLTAHFSYKEAQMGMDVVAIGHIPMSIPKIHIYKGVVWDVLPKYFNSSARLRHGMSGSGVYDCTQWRGCALLGINTAIRANGESGVHYSSVHVSIKLVKELFIKYNIIY